MKNFIILAQLALLVWFGSVIVRLENYHYANMGGMCGDFRPEDPRLLFERERCLFETETRTSPFWHLAYALDLI